MKRNLIIASIVIVFTLVCSHSAHAFVVSWGNSWDPDYTPGYDYLAQWLVDNGYKSNITDATNTARYGYIGYGASDPDPFYWNNPHGFTVEIVQEIAGYKDITTLGYYTGNGATKVRNQVLAGTEDGPQSILVNGNIGLYINSPYLGGRYWYTGRAEHQIAQSGSYSVNAGGDAQALIYELIPNQEWLVAWEDLDATRPFKYVNGSPYTDNDYNDMFVIVTANTTPEPATLSLLGLSLFGLLGFRRKK